VAQGSKGLQFTTFPVKIFIESVPQSWQRALRKALDAWIQVFPLEEVDSREAADIVVSWERLTKESQSGSSLDADARRPGREKDWVQVVKKDDGTILKRTKVAFVALDSSRHWSEEQKRATALHEIGHALGIQGHTERPGDVMFGIIQETLIEVTNQGAVTFPPQYGPPPAKTSPSLPQKPSPRDVNTLIRLYNSPGPLTRLGG
jgi:predicted Zn-dependent protease